MQRQPIASPAVWRGPELVKRTDWIHTLTSNEIAEIEDALHKAKRLGVTLETIERHTFPLAAFPRIVERAHVQLENGPGMFLIRGFPTERYPAADLRMIYWALGKYLGTAVTQSAEGDVLGDVRDLKVDLSGPKGRGYKTNAELEYHTDSCDVVALFVLRTAKAGGRSMIASSVAAHNEVLKRRPDLLEVLYQPFTWSLQNQNLPGGTPTYGQPIFTMHEGHFACRYIRTHIRSAQRYPEVPRLTEPQNEAIALLDSIVADEAMHFSMMFQPGDIQILNNHVTLHARTHYEDYDEPDRKRHLLRMWLSMPNTRALSPALGQIYKDRRAGAVRGGFPSRTGKIVFETTET
jgi:Taurine catabolism dioxygenase TauD, TfdA family